MARPRHHQDLVVWQRSIDLAVTTHLFVRTFPVQDRIATGDQIRAAISVAANIAEGAGRVHRRHFLQFLSIAQGSVEESVTLAEIVRRIGLGNKKELATIDELQEQIRRMLTTLMKVLAASSENTHTRHSPPVTRHSGRTRLRPSD